MIRLSGIQVKACIPTVFKRLSERRLKKNTYILLDSLVCSIKGYIFTSHAVFWLAGSVTKYKGRVKISKDATG